MPRLLMIGLDGFEISLAERWMADGALPNLAALRDRSARYRLIHGPAKYTGLAWEHVSCAATPEALNRHSAVRFDPSTYHVDQTPTSAEPVFARMNAKTVLFDVPYCDLAQAKNAQGLVSWGAHDPGVPPYCRPDGLFEELNARFGPYPATEFIYAMCWQSRARTERAAAALTEAARVRAAAAEWLLKERLPDWEFAVVTVSEPHSVIEPMWHGVDPAHPLHAMPSAKAAGAGVRAVYEETDRLIGRLVKAFPDAAVIAFAMHGMGANGADVPSMALLPELLYRRQFSEPFMATLPWRKAMNRRTPLLAEDQDWYVAMRNRVPDPRSHAIGRKTRAALGRDAAVERAEIDWQPAARYRPFWPQMEAFAVPSFYDGRIRLNVSGRERFGSISPNQAPFVVDALKTFLFETVDPATGEPAVADIAEPPTRIEERGASESDLYVYWKGLPLALHHPETGTVGPIPYRRTGGHSGPYGFFYGADLDLPVGDHGETSSFNVMPTALRALGERVDDLGVSGEPLRVRAKTGAIERAFA
ncbi:MAG: alkaline phosphatase family protein [Pseudomonadota bacterium]